MRPFLFIKYYLFTYWMEPILETDGEFPNNLSTKTTDISGREMRDSVCLLGDVPREGS